MDNEEKSRDPNVALALKNERVGDWRLELQAGENENEEKSRDPNFALALTNERE